MAKKDNKFWITSTEGEESTSAHRSKRPEAVVEDDRTGMSVEALKRAFCDHLYYQQGVNANLASFHDCYMALSHTIRDRLMHRWISSVQTYFDTPDTKAVFYLSAEFLMGRQLGKNLLNTGLFRQTYKALKDFGLDLFDIMEQEPDPGLGNGGLGRLAACFLDSLATLDIPAHGYGIRYEFGIFKQEFHNGWQLEKPDKWLQLGNPWEIARPQLNFEVKFGGYTTTQNSDNGFRMKWIPEHTVLGTPYDTLVPGFNTDTVNTLRLWSAKATKEFDFNVFNEGDYTKAVEQKTFSENISKVLYPNDNTIEGKKLRLRQQYFFVSCSLQDIIRIFLLKHDDLSELPEKMAIQLNDTHPAVGIAELMRLLIDEHGLHWDKAWDITQRTFGYTNHTLLPEALEKWPVSIFGKLLPRPLEIIYEINHRFLAEMKTRFPNDGEKISKLSIIEEGLDQQVRMANLATIGSHAVNGVAALHTELVKNDVLNHFYEIWPEKFTNKTNGVTPRRWIMLSNLKLTYLITEKIGKGWLKDLNELKKLEKFTKDNKFVETWSKFKQENKQDLAEYIYQTQGIQVDPNSIFDVLVKRIHEYKRQLLLAMYIIDLYFMLKENPNADIQPRTFIFGGKAAPGYHQAKLIIKCINSIGRVVNNDPEIKGKIKVVFIENFSVSIGERVYPAADVSEQISMAGKEASGTGNMKFALNGALTVGTLDGANIEIREVVGDENFFLFGLKVDEVKKTKAQGYNPYYIYENNSSIKRIIDSLSSGYFSDGDTEVFRPIVDSLLHQDQYLLLADYDSYKACQQQVDAEYKKKGEWTKKAILNVARMGKFSSDRTIKQYCDEIWNAKPMDVKVIEKGDSETLIEKNYFNKRRGSSA